MHWDILAPEETVAVAVINSAAPVGFFLTLPSCHHFLLFFTISSTFL